MVTIIDVSTSPPPSFPLTASDKGGPSVRLLAKHKEHVFPPHSHGHTENHTRKHRRIVIRMSGSRRGTKAGTEGEAEATTYTRRGGDESLWDDADLVRLWNEQLARPPQATSSLLPQLTIANSKEDEEISFASSSSSSTAASSDKNGESSASSEKEEQHEPNRHRGEGETLSTQSPNGCVSSTEHSEGDEVKGNGKETSHQCASAAAISMQHLPLEVRSLVASFYTAGFEAGRYAERLRRQRENQPHGSARKRQRR